MVLLILAASVFAWQRLLNNASKVPISGTRVQPARALPDFSFAALPGQEAQN